MGACNTAPSRETTLPLRRHGVDSSAPDVPLPIYNPVPGYACFKVPGAIGALVVIVLFAAGAWALRNAVPGIQAIEPVSYYWMMFAVLTLCWEICYITFKFDETRKYADYLKASGTHVWFTYYGWDMILPWNTALVFYGEYGAWADREYSALRMVYSSWARIIEGSHGISAGGFSLLAVAFAAQISTDQMLIAMSCGMAAQGMNAFLYLANYTLVVQQPTNPNYASQRWPCGFSAWRRPFMWINIFWVVLPAYVVAESLILAGGGGGIF